MYCRKGLVALIQSKAISDGLRLGQCGGSLLNHTATSQANVAR